MGDYAEETGDCEAGLSSHAPSAAFIHKKEIGVPFYGEHDGFGLPCIQVLAKLLNSAPVFWSRDHEPGKGVEIDMCGELPHRGQKFVVDGRGNHDLLIEQPKKFETTDAREIENRRSVSNDDQRRSRVSRVRRSSRNSSTP